jgi:hypothetical protein
MKKMNWIKEWDDTSLREAAAQQAEVIPLIPYLYSLFPHSFLPISDIREIFG